MIHADVFLAGECGGSSWRKGIAIPLLQEAGITYYDPQYPEGTWHKGLIPIEREAKWHASWIIDVIGGETRGTASMLEATELVCLGKDIVLVIEDMKDGTEVLGVPITGRDLEDVNRPRAYLLEMINQRRVGGTWLYPKAYVVSSVEEATRIVIARIENRRRWRHNE